VLADRQRYTRCIAAAKQLLLCHGAMRLTAADVVREANVGKETFYRYFDGIPALLAAVDAERASDDEREDVLAVLVQRFASGELDVDEFEARAETAACAACWCDLRRVLWDLPARPATRW
jgi:AcrR family transcriptional regulator